MRSVLVACEYSGTVRDEFEKLGWNAWSCDLLPTEKPGNHYQCDVFKAIEKQKWDLMIAHPPCTYLCNSGVRWLYKGETKDESRWRKMREGGRFFKKLLAVDIPHIAIENPIPHKYALDIIGRRYDCIVQPYEHGHPESKATCLWLKNLPVILPSNRVKPTRGSAMHKLPPSKDRWKIRSKTYEGIAKSLAKTFNEYIKEK